MAERVASISTRDDGTLDFRAQLEGRLEVFEKLAPLISETRQLLATNDRATVSRSAPTIAAAADAIPRLRQLIAAIEQRSKSQDWPADSEPLRLIRRCREDVNAIAFWIKNNEWQLFRFEDLASIEGCLARLAELAPTLLRVPLPTDSLVHGLALAPLAALVVTFVLWALLGSPGFFLVMWFELWLLPVMLSKRRALYLPRTGELKLRLPMRFNRDIALAPGKSTVTLLLQRERMRRPVEPNRAEHWAVRIDPPDWSSREASEGSLLVLDELGFDIALAFAERLARQFQLALKRWDAPADVPWRGKLDISLSPRSRLLWEEWRHVLRLNEEILPMGRDFNMAVYPLAAGEGWQLRFDPLQWTAREDAPGSIFAERFSSLELAINAAEKVRAKLGPRLRVYPG